MGDFETELESIQQAAKDMSGGAIATATQLTSLLSQLASSTQPGDWSDVPSCRAFGASYVGAIKAYEKAAADMLSDAQDMQATLEGVYNDYKKADDRRRDEFDARMAALGSEGYMTERADEKKGYDANRGVLHSDDPHAAPDQPAAAAADSPAPGTTTGHGATGGTTKYE